MNEPEPSSEEPSRIGCLIAAALIFMPLIVFAWTDGDQLSDEWVPLILSGIMIALPFGYLALDGTRSWLPWFVAIGLTALFWGALVVSALQGTGFNFAMIPVMLASPFVIIGCTWAAVQGVRRYKP